MCVTTHLKQPTRIATQGRAIGYPYLVLLRMGFTLPTMLPARRCALTAPFHPYPCNFHDVKNAIGGFLSVALSLGSRQPGVTRHPAFVEPGLSSNSIMPLATIQPSDGASLSLELPTGQASRLCVNSLTLYRAAVFRLYWKRNKDRGT